MADATQVVQKAADHGIGLSAIAASLTLSGVLSFVGALFAVIWYMIQIYESDTFKRIVARFYKGEPHADADPPT